MSILQYIASSCETLYSAGAKYQHFYWNLQAILTDPTTNLTNRSHCFVDPWGLNVRVRFSKTLWIRPALSLALSFKLQYDALLTHSNSYACEEIHSQLDLVRLRREYILGCNNYIQLLMSYYLSSISRRFTYVIVYVKWNFVLILDHKQDVNPGLQKKSPVWPIQQPRLPLTHTYFTLSAPYARLEKWH